MRTVAPRTQAQRSALVAAAAAPATAAVLALPHSAGAAETAPIGSGAGTTGGGPRIKGQTNVVVRDLTYHHNHFGNNHVDGAETACHSPMGAQMLVENNAFRNTGVAVTTNRSSDVDGYAILRGNDLGGAATEVSRVGSFTAPPYGYTAESASFVVASVTSGAGTGKL